MVKGLYRCDEVKYLEVGRLSSIIWFGPITSHYKREVRGSKTEKRYMTTEAEVKVTHFERDTIQGMQAASRNCKRQERNSFLELPEEHRLTYSHLDSNLLDSFRTSDLLN